MAPRISTPVSDAAAAHAAEPRLAFNVDATAITLALALAALIRLNVLPHIGW